MQIEDLKADPERENEYLYESECARLEKVKEILSDKTLQEQFLSLRDYRVIKFPFIIQNILYLLGYKREDINLPGTHQLNWKHVRHNLINDEFFEKLLEYNHRG